MYNNTYERPRTQIEKCEHLARMKFENPIEKAQRERDERVYRFSSIDEAIGVLSARGERGGRDGKKQPISACPSGKSRTLSRWMTSMRRSAR